MNSGTTYSESPLGLLKAMAFGAHTVGIVFLCFFSSGLSIWIVSIDNTILGSV